MFDEALCRLVSEPDFRVIALLFKSHVLGHVVGNFPLTLEETLARRLGIHFSDSRIVLKGVLPSLYLRQFVYISLCEDWSGHAVPQCSGRADPHLTVAQKLRSAMLSIG